MALIKIIHDTFDITRRLQEIDSQYFVVYNTVLKRFEVHNSGQYLDTFCLTVDGELDSRLIDKVNMTRRQNVEKLLALIAKNNLSIQENLTQKSRDELRCKISETYDYLENHDDVNGAYTTRFV